MHNLAFRGLRLPRLGAMRGGGGAVPFSIADLFASSEQGAWYGPSDLSTLFQDSAGTTPVTTAGQPVGLMLDKSGNGNHATQATAGLTSRYQVSPFGSEYDGNDDFSAQPFKPTLAGTIAVRMRSDTASRVAFGSQPASNGRCYIGLASDGSLAGGIGEQATSVIKGSADIRGDLVTGILTWDGTTVSLYQDGVSVYSAAQLGAVNTTVAMHEGALNNNGTAAAFHKGRIAQSIVLDRVMTAAEIASLTNLWSTIS